jgi:hypothetical protein
VSGIDRRSRRECGGYLGRLFWGCLGNEFSLCVVRASESIPRWGFSVSPFYGLHLSQPHPDPLSDGWGLVDFKRGGLRDIGAELRSEFRRIGGKECCFVAGTRDGDIAEARVQQIRMDVGVGVDQDVLDGNSVATNPNPQTIGSQWNCGDNLLVVNSSNSNVGSYDVRDGCPACSTYDPGYGYVAHVDHYNTSDAWTLGSLPGNWSADKH